MSLSVDIFAVTDSENYHGGILNIKNYPVIPNTETILTETKVSKLAGKNEMKIR